MALEAGMVNVAQLEILNRFSKTGQIQKRDAIRNATNHCLDGYRLERQIEHLTGQRIEIGSLDRSKSDELILTLREQLTTEDLRHKTRHPLFDFNRLIIIHQALNGLKTIAVKAKCRPL